MEGQNSFLYQFLNQLLDDGWEIVTAESLVSGIRVRKKHLPEMVLTAVAFAAEIELDGVRRSQSKEPRQYVKRILDASGLPLHKRLYLLGYDYLLRLSKCCTGAVDIARPSSTLWR